jgi:hypothetical protein
VEYAVQLNEAAIELLHKRSFARVLVFEMMTAIISVPLGPFHAVTAQTVPVCAGP